MRAGGLVPAQLLQGQPAHALHEAALDLAQVDQRRQAVPHVVHDVGPEHPVGAGEPVHLDLGRGRAVGEVLERLALHPRRVPVQALGAVEAGRPQLDPLEVGVVDQVGPGELPVTEPDAGDHARGEAHVGRVDAELAGRHYGQPLADLLAGVLDRAAVEVGAGAGRGGRGVRDLVGAGGGQPDQVHRHAQRGRRDLDHLGVQALAHLGAAVVDQHRAVLVHVDQRAGLVERGEVERDPELDRGDGQAALGVRVRGVERGHRGLAAGEVAALGQRGPDGFEPFGVPHRLPVRGGLAGGVEVPPPQLVRGQAQPRGAAAQDVLDDDHALRAAEATERGVGGAVGLGHPAVHLDVGDPVGVVDVAQGPGQHRLGQVQAPAAVAGQRGPQRAQPQLLVEAHLPGGEERVPFAGQLDVLVPVEAQAHRAAGEAWRRGRPPRPARAAGTPCRRTRPPCAGTAR